MGNQKQPRMDWVIDEVVALDGIVQGGIKAEDKEFVVLIELFMMQLLKLAEGDLKLQRKKEVCCVQSFVESLDKLRARKHDMSRSANPRDQLLPQRLQQS